MMKNFFPLSALCIILFSFACLKATAQSCTPNNDTVSGLTPDTLAVAFVGVPYEEVIYFRLPTDTVVPFIILQDTILLTVCIDSLTIDSVHGLPEGITYGCNVPWCSVLGGGNGCASLSGTTQAAGIFPLDVFVTVYVNDCGGFELPTTSDTVDIYFIEVQDPSAVQEFESGDIFSLGKCFPNPAGNEVSVPFYLHESGDVIISVLNPEGKILMEKSFHGKQGSNTELLDISGFTSNSYLVRIESNGRQLYGKLMKQ